MMPPEKHSSTGLIIGLVVSSVMLVGALSFGIWAFSGRQDYKNNADEKVAAAVDAAKKTESARKDAEFAELSKSPVKTYTGPEAFGSVRVDYPKTWSAYVTSSSDRSPFVDAYFNPNFVPDVSDRESLFALRVKIASDSYEKIMKSYESAVKNGSVKVSPFKFAKVPSVAGSKITGEIERDKKGTLIVVPLRANSLQVWADSANNLNDFTKYVLPNLTFSP